MARKRRITTELAVGLTPEMASLIAFASENTEIPPSIFGRIAIVEKLFRDGWPQRAAQLVAACKQ